MLHGQQVRLRAVEPGDLERAYTWINDREVTRYLTARYPLSHGDEERWLSEQPKNDLAAGVVLAIETNEGEHIGNLDLHRTNPDDRRAHLGIMIGEKKYWSNGYGSDAITTLLRFAFGEMNLHKVSLHVFEFNPRGAACYRECGFEQEALLREHYYGEGRYWDVLVMGVLREEFEALHGEAEDVMQAESVTATA